MTKKRKPAYYTVDFITALPEDQCRVRLERDDAPRYRGMGSSLAPMQQTTLVQGSGAFTIERTFPGALQPIRFQGRLDDNEAGDGTWVHGAITHDTENQVLIEGLIVFVVFFLLTALLYVRLRLRGLGISLPLMLLVLVVFSLRWRVMRATTRDLTAWVRRRLYVTAEQVTPAGAKTRANGSR